MSASYDNSSAIVVLPPLGGSRLSRRSLTAWLRRSDVERDSGVMTILDRVLRELGKRVPADGIAGLQMWGQTGERPKTWIAGADPVYLEPYLDHLRLHALTENEVAPADVRQLMNYLQKTLGGDSGFGFARIGAHCYLTAAQPLATASINAIAIDQEDPAGYMPSGDAASEYRGLVSEIEMALHEHPLNVEQEARGMPPVNGLWLWGGGIAPTGTSEAHPPLYSDDPLLRGYWKSRTGVESDWPGTISACLDASVAGFVATTPWAGGQEQGFLESCLGELKDALQAKRLDRLVLLFRDGLRATVVRSQAIRIWRREHPLIDGDRGGNA